MRRVVFGLVGAIGLAITFHALPGAWAVIKPVAVLAIGVVMAGGGIAAALFPDDTASAGQRQETEPNWGG